MKLSCKPILFLCFLILASMPTVLFAQLSTGGLPFSFSQSIPPDASNFVTVERPALDVISMEDIQSPLPYRFAVNLPVDIGIGSSGQWSSAAGNTKVWRIGVKSPGAKALILYFDRYNIPEGGKLFVYNTTRTQLLGAFTSLNNNELSTFATAMIYGEELTIEYNAPENLPLPDIHISEVGHAYRGVTDYSLTGRDFGGSGPCEVNVNCSEGTSWQKEKRSVTRITVKRGGSSVWCTGSLVNTTKNDGKPYVLTADHCGYKSSTTDLSQWIFYFNYEGAGCPDPTVEPPLKSITGATLVAHGGEAGSTGSDFFLVLLKSAIPQSYNVYFNGWSRETVTPSPSGTGIHHPQGDVKKISTYTVPLQPAHWVGNPAIAHWMVRWSGTPNGHGTTEGGSSGSPLFDNQGRLVGTLTGGDSNCDSATLNLPDYYGQFAYSWDKNGTDSINMLKCWLDPGNSGVMTLNGWAVSVQEPVQNDWVTIFPNPVTDRLTIKSAAVASKNLDLTISDIRGRLILQREIIILPGQDLQLEMSAYTAGIYILRVSDGTHQMVRKIVRQ